MSKNSTPIDSTAETQLGQTAGLINHLLARRGLSEPAEAERFLRPDYEQHLHDPFLMRGMAEATARLRRAMEKNERVLIYSDYDADGIPGAVVLRDFFLALGFHNFDVYIPHRHNEGFGMHLEAVDRFAKDGVKLLITIDCGVADAVEVKRAVEHGMEVIITDHHEPNGSVPPAVAVLDPKQPECQYPDKHLCGSGVVFKLIQAMIRAGGFDWPAGREKWYLDLVGLATVSDMVPLVGENRVLAYYGLKVLRLSRRPGLKEMFRSLRLNQNYLTEDDIGFMIAPRINAASRMGVSRDAFDLLAVQERPAAAEAARHLNRINDERKGTVAAMVRALKQKIKTGQIDTDQSVIVSGQVDWRPSLLGLAAGNLAEEYDRPVFLWGRDGRETLKGSARSNGRVNLMELMEAAGDVFDDYGGHSQAAGFSVGLEKIHQLAAALNQAAAGLTSPDSVDSSAASPEFDTELSLDEINDQLMDQLEQLAPFGVGNPKPMFKFSGVSVEAVKTFGRDRNHLELTLLDTAGRRLKAISFFKQPDSFVVEPRAGGQVDLLASVERSYFNGRLELRLRVVDIS